VKIKSLRNVLINGEHVEEGWLVEVDETTAATLIHMRKAVPAGDDDIDIRELDDEDQDEDDDDKTGDDDA
jgi:hypothetical protein